MTTKNSSDGLAARMATLAKLKINDLRAAFTRTTGKPANRLGRDALIKTLAAHDAAPATKASPATNPTTTRTTKVEGRDPRLPAPGGRITRKFKGREYVLEVLERGFRVGSGEYTSTTAAALAICNYGAVSGPAWWGYAKPRVEKPEAPVPTPTAPAKKKAGRPLAPRRSK
jgi:hypothetical protein